MSNEWKIPVKTSAYVMLSSDYGQQEPRITAYVSGDPNMCKAFKEGKDIYASIASIAFNLPYESCLEFHPETHEYQPEGAARRGEAKALVLGICYGRSVTTIGEQLYGDDEHISDEMKTKKAQKIYDSVMEAFPNLKKLMKSAQYSAKTQGYVETILGRRRHIPDMTLPDFEFKAMPGYINPDIDPLDISTLDKGSDIPERIIHNLEKEFASYKYFGQIVKRTRELAEQHIKVINNRQKITDASRECVNCVDFNTFILTTSGWKTVSEVRQGDEILSYDIEKNKIVKDTVQKIHIYNSEEKGISFESPSLSAKTTMNHRWIVHNANSGEIKVKTTEELYNYASPSYAILRAADNDFKGNSWSDDKLKILGWVCSGGVYTAVNTIRLYQSRLNPKSYKMYPSIIETVNKIGLKSEIIEDEDGKVYTLYLNFCDFTNLICKKFPDAVLTWDFVSSLSQHQANVLMNAMIYGLKAIPGSSVIYECSTSAQRDIFQYLCVIAGYGTVCTVQKDDNREKYVIRILRARNASIYPRHQKKTKINGVWCVTTNTGTWIAKRNESVYVTGNSIIQGSAAEMTKRAILNIENNEQWKKIGGRILVPIHDELLCEVPIDSYKEGAEILRTLMEEAGNFLPFGAVCDVTTTLRWYGLEYPCVYSEPKDLEHELTEDEIKWIQYHLIETEVELPIYKQKNGDAPIGDAARGVNGIASTEFLNEVNRYIKRNGISRSDFIQHIKQKVQEGAVLT